MTSLPITYYVSLPPPTRAEIDRTVSQHRTLERVLDWCLAQRPPQWVEEIITQDEFTLDVIVRFGTDRYVVYDTT
jgi:hypothetical protein